MVPSELERLKLLTLHLPVREGTLEVRLLRHAGTTRVAFDDPNLVSCAGLVPAMELAESCDLHGIVAERVRIDGDKGANAWGKVATVVAGMLTGADCIDDLDVLRHGGMGALFGGVYAPSTLGEFLRAFTHGHVRQLQAASREFLVQLARRAPLLPAGTRSRSWTWTRCCAGCTARRSRAPGSGTRRSAATRSCCAGSTRSWRR